MKYDTLPTTPGVYTDKDGDFFERNENGGWRWWFADELPHDRPWVTSVFFVESCLPFWEAEPKPSKETEPLWSIAVERQRIKVMERAVDLRQAQEQYDTAKAILNRMEEQEANA